MSLKYNSTTNKTSNAELSKIKDILTQTIINLDNVELAVIGYENVLNIEELYEHISKTVKNLKND